VNGQRQVPEGYELEEPSFPGMKMAEIFGKLAFVKEVVS
jgi:hypothetical protein